jgi:hypothetical protein
MVERICMCNHHERIFYSKESDIDAYEVFVIDCDKVGKRGWECLVIEYERPA